MKVTREVRLGIDASAVDPDTWRLVAECDDEETSMILIGKQWAGSPVVDAASLFGGLGEALLIEHQARCSACQRWAAGHPTAATPDPAA